MSYKLSFFCCNKFVMKVNWLVIFIFYLLVVKFIFVMREEIFFNSNKMIKNVLIEINKYYFFVYI